MVNKKGVLSYVFILLVTLIILRVKGEMWRGELASDQIQDLKDTIAKEKFGFDVKDYNVYIIHLCFL